MSVSWREMCNSALREKVESIIPSLFIARIIREVYAKEIHSFK